MLKDWRRRKNLTLAQAGACFGLAASQVFYLENGDTFPAPATIAAIEGATAGEVTILDHWQAWRRQHIDQFSKFRAAGRSAAKAFNQAAKSIKESKNGRKGRTKRRIKAEEGKGSQKAG